MDRPTDHYAVLELPVDAPVDHVKRAYRRMVLAHHPDRGGSMARFVQVQRAYDVLADPQARAAYDAQRRAWRDGVRQQARATAEREQRRRREVRVAPSPVRGADVEQVYVLDQPGDTVTVALDPSRPLKLQEPGTWVFRGRGEPGRHGGAAGDLRVVVHWSIERERHEARRRTLARLGIDTADTLKAMLLGIIAALLLMLVGALVAAVLL